MTEDSPDTTTDLDPAPGPSHMSEQEPTATGGSEEPAAEVADKVAEPREVFLEAVRRNPILTALQERPARPSDLTDRVNASRSTIHRATDTLVNFDLITKQDGEYTLTHLGEIVAQATAKYTNHVQTATNLTPFLNEIDSSIPIEHFDSATITEQQPREPHVVIQRLIDLIEGTNHMEMLSTVLSPIHVEVGYNEIMNGTTIEAVFEPDLIDIMLAKYQDKALDAVESGRFTVYMLDGLPFEVFVFDDRMGMAVHDPIGNAEVLVECVDPEAVAWAKGFFDEKRAAAEPLVLPDI